MYNPNIARFLQTDPVGYGAGINLYTYCGNDPLNRTDSMGLWFGIDDAIAAGVGALVGVVSQAVSDVIAGERSEWGDYAIAAVAGAAGGGAFLYSGPVAAGAVAAGVGNGPKQLRDWGQDERDNISPTELVRETAIGAATGASVPGGKVPGATVGRNSWLAVQKQMHTKLQKGLIKNVSGRTAAKMAVGQLIQNAPGALASHQRREPGDRRLAACDPGGGPVVARLPVPGQRG